MWRQNKNMKLREITFNGELSWRREALEITKVFREYLGIRHLDLNQRSEDVAKGS
jgi:hypothetical protein